MRRRRIEEHLVALDMPEEELGQARLEKLRLAVEEDWGEAKAEPEPEPKVDVELKMFQKNLDVGVGGIAKNAINKVKTIFLAKCV